MATKKNDKAALQQERQVKIEETVSKTEQFYNENKKTIWGCIIAAAVIALGVLAYNQFYLKPKVAEAQEQAYPAEAAFRAGNFELALNGDGNNYGFAQVIDEYGSKAGKAMPFYAGVCALQLKDYEAAVDYLKKYKGKDPILAARAQACLGDALAGLERYEEAAVLDPICNAYKAVVQESSLKPGQTKTVTLTPAPGAAPGRYGSVSIRYRDLDVLPIAKTRTVHFKTAEA